MSDLPLPKYKVLEPIKTGTKQADMLPSVEAAKMGLTRYQVLGRKGVLVVIATQAKNPETLKEEPALLLANSRDPQNRHVFVLLSQLYQVIDMGAAREVVYAASQMAPRLFGFVTKFDLNQICDALLEFGDDLRKAKPAQQIGTRDWLKGLAKDGFTIRHNGEAMN